MMTQGKKNIRATQNNLFSIILFRFYPYWPIWILFVFISFLGAFAYLYLAQPTYEATATLLVKDEKKGYDDSRVMEALNIFGSKKIVENEIEVIHSRALMKEVVKVLGLYAPVMREGRVRSTSAYSNSPIRVEAKDPDKIEEREKIYFRYDSVEQTVKIDKTTYPINRWVKTPYGELQFTRNYEGKTGPDPLYFALIPPKKVVTSLITKLNVSAANKLSSVVNLQFVDIDPERAEDILNELINAYNRAGINDKNALADNTLQFVDDRLKHVQMQLDSVEKQVQQYRASQGVVNLSEQSSLFLKNVGENDQRMAMINMQLAVLDQVQKYINSGRTRAGIVPSTLGVDDPVLSQLLQRLHESELEYEKLKNTTAENNPILISLRDEIQRIRPNILENIRVQRINLDASRNQLNATNRNYSETLQTLPEKERRLLEISRQQTIINNVYNFLLQKKEETALSYAATVPDSRILDVAESSIKPVSPKKIIAFPAALAFSFLLTFIFVSFKDFIGSKVVFFSDIETLTDIPALGEVPFVKPDNGLIVDNVKKDYVREQFFKIIAAIGLFQKNVHKKKLLVTSSIPGEGKSFISTNLALTLAQAGKKVILVDLDLKKPSLSEAFYLNQSPGVTEFLERDKEAFDIIHPSGYSNLYIMPAGRIRANSTALLSGNRLESLFSYLENSFDFIVLDTSPIDPVTDALILSEYSDSIVYVARHRYTPKGLLQTLETKKNFAKKDIGIVFNGVKPRGIVTGHSYGYGYEFEYVYKQTYTKVKLGKNEKELIKQG